MVTHDKLVQSIKNSSARSAWQRGVREYAIEILSLMSVPEYEALTEEDLLYGAESWFHYSQSGNVLVADADIAHRLCTPTQLKLTNDGKRLLARRYTWLEVQANALHNAAELILSIFSVLQKAEEIKTNSVVS